MKCLYEVLGVEHDVEESGLKKAYRLLALQWHPDKNQDNLEAAEECFKEIQNAYEILSDPHERAWYDSHRESIMRSGERYQAGGGGFEGGQRPEDEEDLYQFFTSAAFSGFGDGLRGFYGVYNSLFERLAKVEAKAHEQRSDCKGKRAPGPFPRFGFSDAAWPEVTAFYATWGGFATVKDFAWADLYHTASAPNRRVRRAMEGENDKARRAAKREYNEAVRELVAFLRKRDRRVVAHQVEEAKRREQRQAEEAARREAERQERLARAAAYQEAAWVRGEGGSEGSEEDLAEEEQLVWYCVACTKHFKSDAALDNHERSKKHLQQAELLRQVLEEEEAELGGAAAAPDNEDTGSNRAAGKPTQGSSSSSNDGSSSGGGSNLSEVEEEEGEAEGGLRGASGCSSSKSSYAILCGGNRAQPGCGGAAVLAAAAAASTPGQQRDQQKQAAAAAHAQPGSLSDSKSSEEDESGSELDEDGMLMRLVAAHRPQRQAAGSSGSNGTSGSNEESDTSASDDEASGESGSEDRAGQVDEEEDEAALLQRMTPSQPGPGRWQQPQQQPKADEEAVAEGLVAAQLVEGAAEAGRGRDSDWDRKLGKQRGRGGKQQPQQQRKAVTVGQQQHLQPDSEQSQPPPQQPKGGKLSAKEKRWQRHAPATLAAAGSASVQDDMRCSMCQAKFATRNQLLKHLKSEHRS